MNHYQLKINIVYEKQVERLLLLSTQLCIDAMCKQFEGAFYVKNKFCTQSKLPKCIEIQHFE